MTAQTKAGRKQDRLPDKWEDGACAGFPEPDLLLYRSNLLGSDLRLTNYGAATRPPRSR